MSRRPEAAHHGTSCAAPARAPGRVDLSQRDEERGKADRELGQVTDRVDAGRLAVDPFIYRPVEAEPLVGLTLRQGPGYPQRHPWRKHRQPPVLLVHCQRVLRSGGQPHRHTVTEMKGLVVPTTGRDGPHGQVVSQDSR